MPISAPPAGMAPIGKPIAVPRSHGFQERAQSSRLIQTEPLTGSIRSSPPMLGRGDAQRLADGEQRHRERRHLDAVEQVGNAEGKARLAGLQVDADQAERQPDEQRGQPAQRGIAEGRRNGHEGQHHQREIFGRAERQRELDHPRRDEGEADAWRSGRRRRSRSRRSPAPARRGPCAPSCCLRAR